MGELFSGEAVSAFFQVILIDLVLAGDNAIVIGLAASGLPREQRNRAILVGIIAATVLRIIFASITTWLLAIVGLLVAGGLLLLWVCWKMWRELRTTHAEAHAAQEAVADRDLDHSGGIAESAPRKTFSQAAWQIVIADVSMSLDNVLAVAGAAREHPIVLVFGLALSIALMGLAASFIARLLERHRWIAYLGLAIILYVALKMIWEGAFEIHDAIAVGTILPVWWSLPTAVVLTEPSWVLAELWALAEPWAAEPGGAAQVAELELRLCLAHPATAG
jgi:YjbE family integral membrane protein